MVKAGEFYITNSIYNERPLIVITGPTATGKSKLGIYLARKIGGEIVSADSMQVYKGMNIGTAKVTPEEQVGIPHHLIDIIEPGQSFSVAEYKERAEKIIEEIYSRNRFPILVGGTGLYIKTLVYDVNLPKKGADEIVRKKLYEEAEKFGKDYLYNELVSLDTDAAKKIHKNDLRRIIRALEVYYLTGRPISKQQKDWSKLQSRYNLAFIGLKMDRERLYERINKRVEQQVEEGLICEVKNLLKLGITESFTSKQALGYKEIVRYLEGNCTLEEAISTLKMYTRRYAKRQMTWFKKNPDINWINLDDYQCFEDVLQKIIEIIRREINIEIE